MTTNTTDTGDGTVLEVLGAVSASGGVRAEARVAVFPPGATTGWHRHPAFQVGMVLSGVLTHRTRDAVTRYGVGGVIVEHPGIVHEGRNDGTEPVTLVHLVRLLDGVPTTTPCPPPG